MKKITKIESARIVRDQKGDCRIPIKLECNQCFNNKKCSKYQKDICKDKIDMSEWNKYCLADAEAYIKRYDGKCKSRAYKKLAKDFQNSEIRVDKAGGESITTTGAGLFTVTPLTKADPQPIKVDIPEYVYCYLEKDGCDHVARLSIKTAEFRFEDGILVADFKDVEGNKETCECYRTWSEAVSAAGWDK